MGAPLAKPIDRSAPQSPVEAITMSFGNMAQLMHASGVRPDVIVHALLNTVLSVAANTDIPVANVQENLRLFADNAPASLADAAAQRRRKAN